MVLFNIVLADCDLELTPEQLLGHTVVKNYSKKRGKKARKILLDDNYHHSAIRQRYEHTDEQLRRGRPDIVHFNMVYILDSIPNKEGRVRLWVHTRNDSVITVNPTLRIPRSFTRFVGVMEKLLSEGVIKGEDEVLMELEKDVKLQTLLNRLKVERVVKFSPTEEPTLDLAPLLSGDVAVVVGGFSKGDFLSEFKSDAVVSVYKEELTSWAVIAQLMKFI